MLINNDLYSQCVIFSEVYQTFQQQNDAATTMKSWDDILSLASFTIFPPNVTMIIMFRHTNLSFIRPQNMSLNMSSFPIASCMFVKHLK